MDDHDPLRPARGILLAVLFGAAMWAVALLVVCRLFF